METDRSEQSSIDNRILVSGFFVGSQLAQAGMNVLSDSGISLEQAVFTSVCISLGALVAKSTVEYFQNK
jgi:hypothetical protein